MSARKSSHRTIFLIVSSGSPLALIASSLRSTSKNPFCPMTRSLHPPISACAHRVRFVGTWREEFFEAPFIQSGLRPVLSQLDAHRPGMQIGAATMVVAVVKVRPEILWWHSARGSPSETTHGACTGPACDRRFVRESEVCGSLVVILNQV